RELIVPAWNVRRDVTLVAGGVESSTVVPAPTARLVVRATRADGTALAAGAIVVGVQSRARSGRYVGRTHLAHDASLDAWTETFEPGPVRVIVSGGGLTTRMREVDLVAPE